MNRWSWLALLFTLSVVASGATRKWTDSTGQRTVDAEFVEFTGDIVKLKRADGRVVEVPFDKLSQADQRHVRELVDKEKTPAKPTPPRTTRPATGIAKLTEPNVELGNWNEWRGPKRDGICQETGLLQEWPESGPKLLWQADELGAGYGSVVVWKGKIYTLGQQGRTTYLSCLKEGDGKQEWSAEIGTGGEGPNCTPTVDMETGHIYGLTKDGNLTCVDSGGNVVWTKNYERDFGGRMMSSWGFSESPLIDGNWLVCTPGGADAMLASLDKKTGKTRWTMKMPPAGRAGQDGAGYSSIVISQAGGVRQYVQLVGRGVIGVDAEKGEPLWGYNRVANGTANIPTPLVRGDLVFCSSGYDDGGSALLEIKRQGRAFEAREVYYKAARELQNHHGGMILLGNHVFLGHGHNNGFPTCIELASGRKTWDQGRGPGSGSAAIVYADGHLYFRYQDGKVALIEANPNEYRLKSVFRPAVVQREAWPHPVIANGRMYLRDQGVLMCYDVRK